MQKMFYMATFTFVVLLMFANNTCISAITTDEIMQKLASRESQFESVKIEWKERESAAGEFTENSYILLLDANGRIRRTYTKDVANPNKQIESSSYNGEQNFVLTDESQASETINKIGLVWSDEGYDQLNNYHILPILLHYLPSQRPKPAIESQRFTLLPGTFRYQNVDCYVLQSPPEGPAELSNSFWIDPTRDFVIVKHVESSKGITTASLEIDYRKTNDGWELLSWRGGFANGKVDFSATVSEVILKPKVIDTDFSIIFPAGTIVFDRDKGHRYYIKKNGSRRTITDFESQSGFTKEELEASESGKLIRTIPEKKISSIRIALIAVNILVALFIAAYFLTRRLSFFR